MTKARVRAKTEKQKKAERALEAERQRAMRRYIKEPSAQEMDELFQGAMAKAIAVLWEQAEKEFAERETENLRDYAKERGA